jgi:hypothetical protein
MTGPLNCLGKYIRLYRYSHSFTRALVSFRKGIDGNVVRRAKALVVDVQSASGRRLASGYLSLDLLGP